MAETPESVARLFQAALAAMRHPPSCFCGGFRPALGPGALEADLLDYLGPLYARRGESALAAHIAARTAAGSFADWLRDLPLSGLSAAQQALLLEDLAELLGGSVAAAGSGFMCN